MDQPTIVTSPPAGFARHYRRSALTDPWEPLYSRTTDEAVVIGLVAGPAHVNSRGFVHGGLISALADNAMGLSCGVGLGGAGGLVTVSLAVDFLASAQIGQWLAFTTGFVKTGSTLCFAQCFVTADGMACARANATFRVTSRRP
jgi:uncharacterized protein (TIGR00369 family)